MENEKNENMSDVNEHDTEWTPDVYCLEKIILVHFLCLKTSGTRCCGSRVGFGGTASC